MSFLRSPAPWLLLVIVATVTASLLRSPAPATVVAAGTANAQPYDLEAAMALAGHQVPEDLQSYYFFALVENPVPDDEVALLSAKLRDAAIEHDFLGIAGPDAERNRHSLFAALLPHRGRALTGAVVIYVGPAEHRVSVVNAITEAGAEARYVEYPKADTPI